MTATNYFRVGNHCFPFRDGDRDGMLREYAKAHEIAGRTKLKIRVWATVNDAPPEIKRLGVIGMVTSDNLETVS